MSIRLSTAVLVLMFATPAWADSVHDEVVAFAAAKGITEDQFALSIGSSPSKVEAFVYAAEHTGSNALSALGSLEKMHIAMQDPNKRTVLRCMGVKVFEDDGEAPSSAECALAKSRLGLQ